MKRRKMIKKSIETWAQNSEMVLNTEWMNRVRGGDGDDGTTSTIPVPPPPPPQDENP